MSADILAFPKVDQRTIPTACRENQSLGLPMSQVLPLPRVDISGHHPEGRPDLIVFDVEYVRHEGAGGFDVLATFKDPNEAEAFADRWMAANSDMGGGR